MGAAMQGSMTGMGRSRGRFALGLVMAALLLRLLVPAGWMPAANGGFFITLCNAAGQTSVWMDDAGQVHKQKPAAEGKADQDCAFAPICAALDLPSVVAPILPLLAVSVLPVAIFQAVGIGRGLAAPPPPPTGPPAQP